MTAVFVVVFVLVIAGIAMAATGRFAVAPEPAPSTKPEGPTGDPNFDVTFRGYRMDEVDAVLAEKDALLADQEAQIAELKAARAE